MRLWVPRWTQIRVLGNSWIGKASALIPFLGYILSSISELQFESNQFIRNELSYLYVFKSVENFYFGLCLFGIGSFLFQCFCPVVIKKFGDEFEYSSKIGTDLSREELSSMIDKTISISKGGPEEIQRLQKRKELIQSRSEGPAEKGRFSIARDLYVKSDLTNSVTRMAISAFMLTGMMLLFIPTIRNFIEIFISRIF